MKLNYAIAALVLSANASFAANHPPVYAAWSQLGGATSVPVTTEFAAPKVEMRFAVDPTTTCDEFTVAPAKFTGATAPASITPVEWASAPLAVRVCRAELTEEWIQGDLLYLDFTPVLLSSKINHGTTIADMNDATQWVNGPSQSEPVIGWGPGSIGQGDTLRLVTLGDTGCRGNDGKGRHFQRCDRGGGVKEWPLSMISEQAAHFSNGQDRPDLVIHTGDYRYFHERTLYADSWQLWQKDFFPAAQPLLLAAPWVFSRGNHEGCPGRNGLGYGLGYFQFFGTDLYNDCSDLTHGVMEPWYFDVGFQGATAQQAHRFVVLDVNDDGGFASDQVVQNFRNAKAMSDTAANSSWWVAHTPGVQLLHYGGTNHFGDAGVRKALLLATGMDTEVRDRFCASGMCKPSQFLMSHQHLYQSVTFTDDQGNWIFPRQSIVGHSGVDIDTHSNPATSGETCYDEDFPIGANGAKVTGGVLTHERHGMLYWTRSVASLDDPAGWARIFAWPDGSTNPQDPTFTTACK